MAVLVSDKGREPMTVHDLWQRKWWSWGDLNPRPQTFFEQFYMCSRLI